MMAKLRHAFRAMWPDSRRRVLWLLGVAAWVVTVALVLSRFGGGVVGLRSQARPAALGSPTPAARDAAIALAPLRSPPPGPAVGDTSVAGRQAPLTTAAPLTTPVALSVPAGSAPTFAPSDFPTFLDVAVDRTRQRAYASEVEGGRIFVFSLPSLELVTAITVGPSPRGLDISPDGRELAVAVWGAAQIALLDLQSLTVTAHLTTSDPVAKRPYHVIYGRPGRLYSVGDSQSIDYLHVFDTVTKSEVGRSSVTFTTGPPLAVTEDKRALYTAGDGQLYRFDVSTDGPRVTASTGPGAGVAAGARLAIRGDGGVIYTSGGQAWSGGLGSLLATFPAGRDIAYVPGSDRLYVSTGQKAPGSILEIAPSRYSVYPVVRSFAADRMVDVVRAGAAPDTLYAGTDLGLVAVNLGRATVAGPTLLATPRPPAGVSALPSALPTMPRPISSAASRPVAATQPDVAFREPFDGDPTLPQPGPPANWDVTVHTFDPPTWWDLQPVHAGHGPDCAPPPATHVVDTRPQAVFLCRDHLMTTIQTTPYGAIYLTPDHLIDFSAGEARLAFDLSTLGASRANWVDVWITPYEDALQLPSDDERIWPSNRSNGNPRRALHLSMAFGKPDGIPGTDFRPRSSVTSNPARC